MTVTFTGPVGRPELRFQNKLPAVAVDGMKLQVIGTSETNRSGAWPASVVATTPPTTAPTSENDAANARSNAAAADQARAEVMKACVPQAGTRKPPARSPRREFPKAHPCAKHRKTPPSPHQPAMAVQHPRLHRPLVWTVPRPHDPRPATTGQVVRHPVAPAHATTAHASTTKGN